MNGVLTLGRARAGGAECRRRPRPQCAAQITASASQTRPGHDVDDRAVANASTTMTVNEGGYWWRSTGLAGPPSATHGADTVRVFGHTPTVLELCDYREQFRPFRPSNLGSNSNDHGPRSDLGGTFTRLSTVKPRTPFRTCDRKRPSGRFVESVFDRRQATFVTGTPLTVQSAVSGLTLERTACAGVLPVPLQIDSSAVWRPTVKA